MKLREPDCHSDHVIRGLLVRLLLVVRYGVTNTYSHDECVAGL